MVYLGSPNILSLNKSDKFNETLQICFQIEPPDNYSIEWYYTSNLSIERPSQIGNNVENITEKYNRTSYSTLNYSNVNLSIYCLTITRNVDLINRSVLETDEGKYFIRAINSAGLSETSYIYVVVHGKI